MDSLTLSIAIARVTSVCAAILGILFFIERDEADRLAEENTELRDALEAKRKEADTLSDEIKRLAPLMRGQSEAIESARREINSFHARGYYRNAYGTLQRYSEWFEFGDKKPKPKRTTAQKIKDVGNHFIAETAKIKDKKLDETGRKPHQLKQWMQVVNVTDEQKNAVHDACVERGIYVESLATLNVFTNIFFNGGKVCGGAYSDDEDINIPFDEFMARIKGEWVEQEPKPMTRAEACLAILHEAKDAGFEWAESAIKQFDEDAANSKDLWECEAPLSRAVGTFNWFRRTKEGCDYWSAISCLPEVKSFKPKTQWPA